MVPKYYNGDQIFNLVQLKICISVLAKLDQKCDSLNLVQNAIDKLISDSNTQMFAEHMDGRADVVLLTTHRSFVAWGKPGPGLDDRSSPTTAAFGQLLGHRARLPPVIQARRGVLRMVMQGQLLIWKGMGSLLHAPGNDCNLASSVYRRGLCCCSELWLQL